MVVTSSSTNILETPAAYGVWVRRRWGWAIVVMMNLGEAFVVKETSV